MLKLFVRGLFALAFCSVSFAQNPRNGNLDVLGYFNMAAGTWSAPFVPVSTDPTGACSHAYQIVINSTSGQMTACIGSAWVTLGGGGGGSLSGLTPGALQLAASSTTLAASAISDDGTTVRSSEPVSVSSGGTSAIIIGSSHTPASSSEACTTGTIVWDSSFIYVCKSTNSWARASLSGF